MLEVADYCVKFQKNRETSVVRGCYGYPGAILLLTIVDTIGSFVIEANTEKNFRILNDPLYYGLSLDAEAVRAIYDAYRNDLDHTSVLGYGFYLDRGREVCSLPQEVALGRISETYRHRLGPQNSGTAAPSLSAVWEHTRQVSDRAG